MRYIIHSHRYAESILENEPEFNSIWSEIKDSIESISENDIIEKFEEQASTGTVKSISAAINRLLADRLIRRGWFSESPIFQDTEYSGDTWRLDFAKQNISIEVAFNHATVIAWNLLKPVLASELNHVRKAIQTKIGVIITATSELKMAGGFDGAIGTFEKFIEYLKPLNNQLTVPILLIGLEKPQTFVVSHVRNNNGSKQGVINYINNL